MKNSTGAPMVLIPNEVIDRHLKTASGEAIKTLLAILRTDSTDLKKIAAFTGLTESEILDSLYYWKQQGVLFHMEELSRPSAPAKKNIQLPVSPDSITAEELSEQRSKRDEIRFLFSALEGVCGRPLTSTEEKGYLYINEYMGLPIDVILMAVEYCVSNGKANFNYIQKLCAGWADDEINTHSRAEEYIMRLTQINAREDQVREAFGIKDRALTATNKQYIRRWFEDYGFSIGMIRLAYERAADRIGKLSFPYINKILQNWKEAGLLTPAQVDAQDKKYTAKPAVSGEGSASYDIDEFENRGFNIPKID